MISRPDKVTGANAALGYYGAAPLGEWLLHKE